MASSDRRGSAWTDLQSILRSGTSVIALCVLAAAAPAYAQTAATAQQTTDDDPNREDLEDTAGRVQSSDDLARPDTVSTTTQVEEVTTDPDGDEIIVTGIRQSLANSQNIKRSADTVVDAITAEDIGALPDRSVTEALQRVPGVQINRFAGSNDPDHFSVEGSGVVVRGLSFVRSEFNGRDTFSTGVYGQAINFADVPAELLGSVEVYKNSTAEMIEGGLSGTVNMNLRRPFDNAGLHIGFTAEANYSDHAKKWSPVGSLLVSNTWETGIGRVGLLGAIAYSQVFSRADGIQVTNFQTRDGRIAVAANTTATPVCREPLPTDSDDFGFPPALTGDAGDPCYGAAPAGADGFADFADVRYAPVGGQFRTQDFNRERTGIAGAAQWESLDRRALVTASFLRSEASQKWGEHTFEAAPDLSEYNTFPAGCQQNGAGAGGTPRAQCPVGGFTNYEYDEDRVFERGFITLPGTGWRTGDSGSAESRVPTGGMQHSLSRRQVDDYNLVQDHGLNFKYTPNDHWAFNVDAQYVKAEHDNLDVSVFGSIFADQEVDLTGELPVVVPHVPVTLNATWAAPNTLLGGLSDEEYFADPRFTFWRAAMDHAEESRGKEWAFRGDASYSFLNEGFLKRLKFGARWADRDQKIRYTTYNWGSLSEVWSGRAIFMDEVGENRVETYDFDNFFRGDTAGPPTANYYSGDLIGGYRNAIDFFRSIQDAARAAGGGGATSWMPLAARPGVVEGTMFLPGDIQEVSELNRAAYSMLSFDDDRRIFGGVRIEGNLGVRYVHSDVKSLGVLGIPTQAALNITQPFDVRCAETIPAPPAPQEPRRPGGVCTLGPEGYAELQQWATGETRPNLAKNDYAYWLPSLNIKASLTDELILRLAASRNLARPGMNDIRNFEVFGTDPSAGFALQLTTGNPFLKPAISDNFDAGLEWYFARVGSLTLNAFAKNIHNFFFQNVSTRDVTSNGITQTVFVRHPDNYDETGKVRGFELAYQQTYDFLPGVLSGLGLSANYTYIKSKGLSNAQLFVGSQAPIGTAGNLPLEQLSKHNVNVAAFYEKGPLSVRAAYNWRSRFLLTASDVIFPYFPIYNDETGQLDASAFYSINDQIKIGVQGVNLTNEVTKTLQQFTTDGLLGPRSYFMNDRRYSFIVRGSF